MNKLILFFLCFLFAACTPRYKDPHILIETNIGDIEVELYPEKAPKTVARFMAYIDQGLYDKSSFYRVLKIDGVEASQNVGVIQGGIWRTNPVRMTGLPPIAHEPTSQTGLSHTEGTISMARSNNGGAGSEFFICIGDQRVFDAGGSANPDGKGYAAFGKVFKGMPVVRKIQDQPNTGETFNDKIVITSIKKL